MVSGHLGLSSHHAPAWKSANVRERAKGSSVIQIQRNRTYAPTRARVISGDLGEARVATCPQRGGGPTSGCSRAGSGSRRASRTLRGRRPPTHEERRNPSEAKCSKKSVLRGPPRNGRIPVVTKKEMSEKRNLAAAVVRRSSIAIRSWSVRPGSKIWGDMGRYGEIWPLLVRQARQPLRDANRHGRDPQVRRRGRCRLRGIGSRLAALLLLLPPLLHAERGAQQRLLHLVDGRRAAAVEPSAQVRGHDPAVDQRARLDQVLRRRALACGA